MLINYVKRESRKLKITVSLQHMKQVLALQFILAVARECIEVL